MPAANPLQFGRAYQLPPFGRGNGLEALFWTPSERLPAGRVDAVLAALRECDVPAWVAPARIPGVDHRSADAPHDLWVAADRSDESMDVVMLLLSGGPGKAGAALWRAHGCRPRATRSGLEDVDNDPQRP